MFDIAKIFEVGKMLLIVIMYIAAILVVVFGWRELSNKVFYPWEKEEKKAAKKREREERRARREFWGS